MLTSCVSTYPALGLRWRLPESKGPVSCSLRSLSSSPSEERGGGQTGQGLTSILTRSPQHVHSLRKYRKPRESLMMAGSVLPQLGRPWEALMMAPPARAWPDSSHLLASTLSFKSVFPQEAFCPDPPSAEKCPVHLLPVHCLGAPQGPVHIFWIPEGSSAQRPGISTHTLCGP